MSSGARRAATRSRVDLAYDDEAAAAATSGGKRPRRAASAGGAAAAPRSSAADAPASPPRAVYVSATLSPGVSPGRRAPTFLEGASAPAAAAAAAAAAAPSAAPDTAGAPAVDWRGQLAAIRRMRERRDAPVDTMGCSRCHDPTVDAPTRRYQILVSLMLSSQTKDEVVFATMERLRAHGCTPARIAATPPAELEELLYGVGFWRQKAKFLAGATALCLSKYGGDIPPSPEALQEITGVGPKMAFIAMHAAWGTPVGIGVDIHVHRISNRLGWVRTARAANGPEATRAALEGWLPRELWGELNELLVGFGQQVCTPTAPHCGVCLARDICPSGGGGGGGGGKAAAAAGGGS